MSKVRKLLTIALLALTVVLGGAACAPVGEAIAEANDASIAAPAGMDREEWQAPPAFGEGKPAHPEGHGGHAADPVRALPGLLANIGIVALIIAAVQGVQWLTGKRGSRRSARRIEAASPLG